MFKNKLYKYILILIILGSCGIRLVVAVRTSIASSKISVIKNDENKVLEENRKLKETAYGNSIVSLEAKAQELEFYFPEKIIYLKTPENLAGF